MQWHCPSRVLILSDYGADVNAQDRSHKTPLHVASSQVSTVTLDMVQTDVHRQDDKADEKADTVQVLVQP